MAGQAADSEFGERSMSADTKLKTYIERILRCREAEDDAKKDTKEVYSELAGDGYEKAIVGQVVNHIRKREKDGDRLAEQSAKFELYLEAYELPSHVHAREANSYSQAKLVETVAAGLQTETVRKALVAAVDVMIEREEGEHIDPETGEITNSHGKASDGIDPSRNEGAANTEQGDVDSSALRASSAVEVGATNSPEAAKPSLAELPSDAVSERTATLVDASASAEAVREGQPSVTAATSAKSAAGERHVEATVEQRSSAPNFEPPAFLKSATEEPRLNPQCQKAAKGENCTFSHSMASCWRCTDSAMKEKSAKSSKVMA